MQPPPFFSNHENNGLLVKLKPIPHLNEWHYLPISKMFNFVSQIQDDKTWKRKTLSF